MIRATKTEPQVEPQGPGSGVGHDSQPHLQRRFGLLQATALNMSNMIGIGPFITIPALMAAMGGPQAMLGWVVGLVIACGDGLVWSELGAAMPGSGGTYIYLRDSFGRETLGRAMAFLFIWQFLLSGPLEIASGYIGFAQYAKYLWPGLTDLQVKLVGGLVGVAIIGLLYRRITTIGKITVALWIGTMLTVGVVMVTGPFHFNPKLAFDFPPGAFTFSVGFLMGLGAASRLGVYDYLGYYDVCYIGDEVRDPGRVIPRSILISLFAVVAIYVTINLALIGVVPWREFVPAAGQPLPDPAPPVVSWYIEKLYGTGAARVFTWMVLWTAFASCFSLMLGYSRIPYAASRDGNFFGVFSRLHPRKDFPYVSLLFVGGLSILCSFFPLMTVIDALLTTRIVVQFIGQVAAVLWLRRTSPYMERPFRIWFYPLPVFVALLGWIFLLVTTDLKTLGYAGASLVLGVVFFIAWSRTTRRWPYEQKHPPAATGL
ncbi:MAG TPA: APC family permease [Verrucomicrobiae bacterium]|nr:APC family permease [Verrucomicrobiae bacterium]